jgi:hypothetical protein
MKERLSKLLSVKSLVTLSLTGVMCYLAIIGKVNIENIYLMIISFYFGTQLEKVNKEK